MRLTDMQKRYVWLAGSYPALLLVQGRGYRTPQTMYRIDEEAGELTIFGYSNPCYFLEGRGIVRKGQAPHSYNLTEDGERLFQQLLVSGAGEAINRQIRQV